MQIRRRGLNCGSLLIGPAAVWKEESEAEPVSDLITPPYKSDISSDLFISRRVNSLCTVGLYDVKVMKREQPADQHVYR